MPALIQSNLSDSTREHMSLLLENHKIKIENNVLDISLTAIDLAGKRASDGKTHLDLSQEFLAFRRLVPKALRKDNGEQVWILSTKGSSYDRSICTGGPRCEDVVPLQPAEL